MWIVLCDLFLMKKLLKSEICESMNSTQCVLIGWKRVRKVKLCSYCAWTVAVSLTNGCKKKKEKRQTQMLGFSAQSKRILSACLDSAFFAESCVSFFLFYLFIFSMHNWRQRLLFMYCTWTVPENFDFSAIFNTSVGPVNSARNPQTSLFSNFFMKNGSHDTIHTFKNYFVTVFSVSAKISSIQTNPNGDKQLKPNVDRERESDVYFFFLGLEIGSWRK